MGSCGRRDQITQVSLAFLGEEREPLADVGERIRGNMVGAVEEVSVDITSGDSGGGEEAEIKDEGYGTLIGDRGWNALMSVFASLGVLAVLIMFCCGWITGTGGGGGGCW